MNQLKGLKIRFNIEVDCACELVRHERRESSRKNAGSRLGNSMILTLDPKCQLGVKKVVTREGCE